MEVLQAKETYYFKNKNVKSKLTRAMMQLSDIHLIKLTLSCREILVSQNNETATMLVSQTSPVGVELFSYANAFFCSNKFA